MDKARRKHWRNEHSTGWCKVSFQELIGRNLDKKCTAFYGARRYTTVFTAAGHLYLYRLRQIQSTTSHPICLRSCLMLSSDIRLNLSSGFFQVFPHKTCTHFSSASCVPHVSPISPFSRKDDKCI
jgi:hypothetical protein